MPKLVFLIAPPIYKKIVEILRLKRQLLRDFLEDVQQRGDIFLTLDCHHQKLLGISQFNLNYWPQKKNSFSKKISNFIAMNAFQVSQQGP